MVEIREPGPRDDVDDVPLNLFKKLRHAKNEDETVKHSINILKVKFNHLSGKVEENSPTRTLNQKLILSLSYFINSNLLML